MLQAFAINFLFLLCFNSVNAQNIDTKNLLGKWKPAGSASGLFHFLDNENIQLTLDGKTIDAKYSLVSSTKTTELIIRYEEKFQHFVILEREKNKIQMCFRKDYDRVVQAKQAKVNKLSWGWNNPIMILERQDPN